MSAAMIASNLRLIRFGVGVLIQFQSKQNQRAKHVIAGMRVTRDLTRLLIAARLIVELAKKP